MSELKSEWISVEDDMPNGNFDFVLALDERGAMDAIAYTSDSGFYRSVTHLSIYKITHWMPLPAEPGQ